jgi:2-oxoisovalerate dehydrogenase E2 component (dihydrolipoyl transacylase)
MPTAVIMPQLGESVVEGTVNQWLKAVGETVDKLEPLLEIATDKIDTEVPAPAGGVLLTVLVVEGQTVDAGTVLAYIGAPGETIDVDIMADTGAADLGTEERLAPEPSSISETPAQVSDASKPSGRGFVSPVVARLAAEQDVKLDDVTGTGMNGRITKKDVLQFIEKRGTKDEAQKSAAMRADASSSVFDLGSSALPSDDEILQPLTTMRRATAKHMVQSKRISPHVTTVFEVDMTAVVQHREVGKDELARKGIRLTFTPYFVAAAIVGLKAVPELNARFTGEGVLVNRRIHIGVAAAVEHGLIVPVLRDADEMNLQGLARAVNELTEQARANQLSPDQLSGGTFTITNHGISGSLIGTPIINQPQTGILGIGAIVKRPVVQSLVGNSVSSLLPSADDAIVIRPMCYLSLTFDHRVLDGAMADKFLSTVKKTLEEWTEREE